MCCTPSLAWARRRSPNDIPPDGLPYLAGGDAPDGYAMVTFSTDDVDRVRHRHVWLVDDLGRWLNAQGLRWCWQYNDDVWVTGHIPPKH